MIKNIDSGEIAGTSSTLSVVAPTPSAIDRRRWLLKAVNMSSCLEMDVNISHVCTKHINLVLIDSSSSLLLDPSFLVTVVRFEQKQKLVSPPQCH